MTENINLISLNEAQGFAINGANANNKIGYSVNNAGDFNGDGIDDIIIGSPKVSPGGSSYVIFGSTSGLGTINLDNLNENQGFALYSSTSGGDSGYSVSGAGDINNDGFDDVIIGAYIKQIVYVIFGHAGTVVSINLDTITSSQGFKVINGNNLGRSVSGIGDFNNDGYDDILIGATTTSNPGSDRQGTSYLLFGHSGSFSNIDLSTSLTQTQGFLIRGSSSYLYSGYSVSGAGDINRDGYADIIIGAPGYEYTPMSTGISYVIFGGTNTTNINLANLDANRGFSITGAASGDRIGISVSNAGDFNGDGYDDVIIGAPYMTTSSYSSQTGYLSYTHAGTSYIVFGNASNHLLNINLADTVQHGWIYIASYTSKSNSGYSVSGAYDVNGDGYYDVVIGAPEEYGSAYCISYVIFGSPKPINLDLNSLIYNQGFTITYYDGSTYSQNGFSVGLTDINGDGYADVLSSAPEADASGYSSNTGIVYVIYGSITPTALPTPVPTSLPTKKPTVSPTIPTLTPTSPPTSLPTFFPTPHPTVTPSTPTLLPTMEPSFPTTSPTVSPSPTPTSFPSIAPTSPPTIAPSPIPTSSPSVVPTSPPTIAPTQYIPWIITDSGSYIGTSANDYFTINSNYNIQISGNGGYDRYIMIPHSNVITAITDFSNDDKIDLTNFANINDYSQIIIKYNSPTMIYIPLNDGSDEQIELSNSALVSENSFIINPDTGNTAQSKSASNSNIIIKTITSTVSVGSLLTATYCFSKTICFAAFDNLNGGMIIPSSSTFTNFILYPCHKWYDKAYNLELEIRGKLRARKDLEIAEKELDQNADNYVKNSLHKNNLEVKAVYKITYENPLLNHPQISKIFKEAKQIGALKALMESSADAQVYEELTNNIETMGIKDAVTEFYSKSSSAQDSVAHPHSVDTLQFSTSDDVMISLLSARQIIEYLPLMKHAMQGGINYLGYNITLPEVLENKAILATTHLILGNSAAQYLPAESIMSGMFISTASTASYAARLVVADYLKNQEPSEDPIEFAQQCVSTIAAYSLPGVLNYVVSKAILPDTKISISTLDMLGSSSFGIVQCYNNYKAVYADKAQSTATDIVVPYIADAITLWSLRDYLSFDTNNAASLMTSVKNAMSVAATTYAAHCMSNMIMGVAPQEVKEEYIDPVFNFASNAINDIASICYQSATDVSTYIVEEAGLIMDYLGAINLREDA